MSTRLEIRRFGSKPEREGEKGFPGFRLVVTDFLLVRTSMLTPLSGPCSAKVPFSGLVLKHIGPSNDWIEKCLGFPSPE